jgi:hypothetical protein
MSKSNTPICKRESFDYSTVLGDEPGKLNLIH